MFYSDYNKKFSGVQDIGIYLTADIWTALLQTQGTRSPIQTPENPAWCRKDRNDL